MNYLYHRVPKNLTGEYLMPLNQLKKTLPKVYQEHVKKYIGRESLLDFKIPVLNCLWNDVLHMITVPPKEIKLALRNAGYSMKNSKWFKINPNLLGSSETIIYLYKKNPLNADLSDFVPFHINDLREYSSIGNETKKYFKEEISHGRKPLTFAWTPHILYKGKLKISDLEVIEI